MPTYSYECQECNSIEDDIRPYEFSHEDGECTRCGGVSKRLFSMPRIHLDGSDPNFVSAHERWVKEHETKGNGVRSSGNT